MSHNVGQDAGAIMNFGTTNVTRSTVSGNNGSQGSGGAFANAGDLSIADSTISGNYTLGSGSTIDNMGTVTLINSILVGEAAGSECYGSGYTSLGYNIGSDDTCGLSMPTDQPDTAALLGPLQDNDGPTETHALLAGSPALDQGSCPGATIDQRGLPRPVDIVGIPNAADGCDIGAFELQPQIEIDVDIKPGSSSNPINPGSRGDIPVAILTTDTLDATTVDPLSVRFGPAGAAESHGRGHIRDVDRDGDLDLLLHFRTQETGIQCGDLAAVLTGETFDGQPIEGSDSLRTVSCK